MSTPETDALCVGVCMVDAEGYCLGCGRPPQSVQLPEADDGDATLMATSAESATASDD